IGAGAGRCATWAIPPSGASLWAEQVSLVRSHFTLTQPPPMIHERPRRDGALFFAFLAGYGLLRLVLLPFRADAHALQWCFSTAFLTAGCLGLVGSARWRSARGRGVEAHCLEMPEAGLGRE